MNQNRKHPLLRNLLTDLLCTGIALVIFALFHHVLPRQQQSVGIVIENPYQVSAEQTAVSSAGEEAEVMAEPVSTLASEEARTGTRIVSDIGRSAGRSGKSNRSRNQKNSGKNGSNMNSKGGSALTGTADTTESEDSASAASQEVPIADKFADRYTDEVVVTDSSYTSPDVSITVTEQETDNGRITYYLADIYVRDITCFRTALAEDTYGSGYRDSITDMAVLNNALLAINGDYYGNTNEGVVIRNGVIYRANPTDCDVCVLYYDGTMRVMPGSSFSAEEAIADGAWQAWTFGPALLDTDGNVLTAFSSTQRIISANPRTAIGYYEPGHYCMVVVDGRGDSAGITLPQLSQLFSELGCTAAYNLDGGNSSIMVWQNEIINQPSGGGRESSDALLIAEVPKNE